MVDTDGGPAPLSRRETGWVLRRCSRQGHVVAWLDDPSIAEHLERPPAEVDDDGIEDAGPLVRCLRCGSWVRADDPLVTIRVGSPDARAPLADVPLPARGSHGRKFALLRLLAVERLAKGLALLTAAFVAYHVASDRVSLLAHIERLLVAARPLGEELGLHLTTAAPVVWLENSLGGDGGPLRLAGLLLLAYGVLQLVEGVGLWGGWRWAEYLAAAATSAFVPLEIYEIVEQSPRC